MKFFKHLLLFLLLLSPVQLCAGFELGQWQVYPSYWSAQRCVAAGKTVYALMSGNLIAYDTEEGSVRTFNVLDDLNDTNIALMGYSPETKRLILVYENQDIDILSADGNQVSNIAALMNTSIRDKETNDLVCAGGEAFLCTNFGFLAINLKDATITDTYNFKVAVKSFCATPTHFWMLVENKTAPNSNGIYRIERNNKDMHRLGAWQRLSFLTNAKMLAASGDKVLVADPSGIYRTDGTTATQLHKSAFSTLRALPDGQVWMGKTGTIALCTDGATIDTYPAEGDNLDLALVGKTCWMAQADEGLCSYQLDGSQLQPTGVRIQPNSPKRDMTYRINYAGNRLLVAGGKNESIWFPLTHEPVAMFMDADGSWTNFDEAPAKELVPEIAKQYNTESLAQDPNDPTHHFAGTFRFGLKEYRNGKLVKVHHANNSPLRSAQPANTNYLAYTTADAIAYDPDGNLWVGNQRTDTIVRFITPDGKWHRLNYPEIAQVEYVYQFLFHSSGIRFLMGYSDQGTSYLFAFDTNGTLDDVRDDRHKAYTNFVNQDGTAYKPRNLYCAAEDLDGAIWLGTLNGLFVLPDPTSFFDEDFNVEQIKVPRNDGSGLADYLLNGVSVTSIAVDAANRKWVGTDGNGLLLFSPDGMEQIHHFQANNSPLLSDNITSLAINHATGLVMIATDRGLCSFQSDATQARNDLLANEVIVYPNPITPNHQGLVRIEGLTANSEVKITTTSGQVLWSGTSHGGTCSWNGCDRHGRRLASGVYHVVANTEDGSKAVVSHFVVVGE